MSKGFEKGTRNMRLTFRKVTLTTPREIETGSSYRSILMRGQGSLNHGSDIGGVPL